MRKDAREVVFKILYSELYAEFDRELFDVLCEDFKLSESEKVFAEELLKTVHEHKSELDELISSYAQNYRLDRIYPTDKCALYIGLAEMTYSKDVPPVVAIDEAMALCRSYSTKESTSFVNGIFAKYKTDLEKA